MVTKKQNLIDFSKSIIEDYGHAMTVRQIYYRLVALHDYENKTGNYKYLVKALSEARRTEQIPYNYIEDRTRRFIGKDRDPANTPLDYYQELKDTIKLWAQGLLRPRWETQHFYVEVWVEKQALEGVFSRALQGLGVTLAICRGYPSLTYQRDALIRIVDKCDNENEDLVREPIIFYYLRS